MFRIRNLFLKGLTDEALMQKYKASGDTVYFGELFQRYSYVVLGTCKKYLYDKEKSKDAVMHIFEDLLSKVLDKEINSFSTWIYVVSKNHCLMKLRQDEFKNTVFLDDELIVNFKDNDSINVSKEDNESYFLHLEGCLEKLNESQKKCVDLFYLQENPYKIITEITGYSLVKVKSYIQNGKRNLKNCLERKVEHERL